jgi:endopolyphosphatase
MNKEKASAVMAKCGWSKWSLGAILLCLPALAVYKHSNQLLPLIGSYHEPQESVTVEYLDFDVAEYKKLGLTPQRPVRVQGNHRSQTIHGRFLHITDIHPDEHYKEGSDIDNVCHRGKPGKASKGASKYGDATLGCDTPVVLMNETMEWIRNNLRDKIDFVIWTGDNIRHDNDRKIPRTEMQIFDMNGRVARIFHDIFHGDALDPRHYDVPVIPSLGNNDVYPHNLFAPGPTLQTRELWSLWQSFIPEEQLHVFERGSYYFNEVIPNQLAVLSINTLYLFKANPLVDNCDNRKDPGFKLFQWLGVTLEELRLRGMKVWLSGHVPPIPKNYDITCYRKFVLWLHEYRDIIIGGVYGHMNMDHFIPVDAQKAYKSYHQSLLKQGFEIDDHFIQMFELDEGEPDLEEQYLAMGFNVSEPDLNVAIAAKEAHALGGAPTNKESYMASVRETFYADVKSKKKSGIHSERYAITNVAASVIPTFNPGFRIWEYNITGIEERLSLNPKPWGQFFAELEAKLEQNDFDDEIEIMGKKKKKGEKKKEPDISLPKPMPDDAELGPGYVPQTLSPLRFVQYYLDLKAVNGGEKPLEFEVEYTSDGEPYNMKSLLVDDFLTLARKLGKPLKNLKPKSMNEEDKVEEDSKEAKLDDLWETYVKFAFVSSGYHD